MEPSKSGDSVRSAECGERRERNERDARGESGASTAEAMEAAVAMLARRAMSVQRLVQRLRPRFGSQQAAATASRLRDRGLLNDAHYAGAYARDRFERRGYARQRIAEELLARGVDRAIIDLALEEVVDEASERVRAEQVLARFFASAGRDPSKLRDRAAACRHLAGRGYSEELIGDLIGVSL